MSVGGRRVVVADADTAGSSGAQQVLLPSLPALVCIVESLFNRVS